MTTGTDRIYQLWRSERRIGTKGFSFDDFVDVIVKEIGPYAGEIDMRELVTRGATGSWATTESLVVLVLEQAGMLRPEHDDDYVLAHLTGLRIPGSREYFHDRSATFRDETLWRFFEIAGGGEVSLTNVDKFYGNAWSDTFMAWVESGRLPRERVLASCVSALGRDFGAYTCLWFSALLRRLAPTPQELKPLEPALRRLLASSVGPTVTLATTSLRALHKAGLLDLEPFVSSATAALSGSKATVMAVLSIARDAAADPAFADAVSALHAAALEHPHRDVQAAAVTWLAAHGGRASVDAARAALAPSVLAAAGFAPVAGGPVAAVADRSWSPLVPWPADEVVERLAVLLEDAGDPCEVENGLRALATLTDVESLAPLAKAAQRAVARAESYPTEGIGLRGLIGMIVLAACGTDHVSKVLPTAFPPLVFERFEEVRRRVLRRSEPHVLLATPSDSAGRVTAADLVARLAPDVWSSDLTAALLRLQPPEGVVAVPGSASAEVAEVLRWALGGKAGKIRTPEWWVAAAQARDPEAEHTLLLRARLGAAGQGRPLRGRLALTWEPTSKKDLERYPGISAGVWRIGLEVPGSVKKRIAHQPTAVPGHPHKDWVWASDRYNLSAETARFVGLTWPRSAEFAALVGLPALIVRSYYGEVAPGAEGVLDALDTHPGSIGELGRSALVLGLSAKDTALRRRAAEVFAAAVPDRVSPAVFATTAASIVGLCTLTRLADAFADAASISDAAATAVTDVLIALLPHLDRGTTGLAALLALLDDELLRAGRRAHDEALRLWLGEFSGSSKGAKSARSILAR